MPNPLDLLKGTAELGQRIRRFMGGSGGGMPGGADFRWSTEMVPMVLVGDATLPGSNGAWGRRFAAQASIPATPSAAYFYATIPTGGFGAQGAREDAGVLIQRLILSCAAAANTALLAPDVRVGTDVFSFSNAGNAAYTERPLRSFDTGGGGATRDNTVPCNAAWDGALRQTAGGNFGVTIARPYVAAGATIELPVDVFLPAGAFGAAGGFLWVNNLSAGTMEVTVIGQTKGYA